MKNFFKSLDITGSDYTLYRNRKRKSSSTFGGFLSTISIIVICYVSIIKMKDYFENQKNAFIEYLSSIKEMFAKDHTTYQDETSILWAEIDNKPVGTICFSKVATKSDLSLQSPKRCFITCMGGKGLMLPIPASTPM